MKGKIKKVAVFTIVAAIAMFTAVTMASSHDWDNSRRGRDNDGAVRLLTTIPIPATSTNSAGGKLYVYDISFIDPDTQLYYLADRNNNVIDVIDAKRDTFVTQIHGNFKGYTGNTGTSGPNGVVASGRWLFVTDAASRVVSIDLNTNLVVSEVNTGGADGLRTDELAYDPKDRILFVVNNADDPPFATLISVDETTGKMTLGQRITFDQLHAGFNATNGAEQPAWDPGTGKFYLSIPEVNCPSTDSRCGGAYPEGAVIRINPRSTGKVEAIYPVEFCQPAGLTLGPKGDFLVGCSQAFDTLGKAWSSTDAATAAPLSVIMDARTGSIDKYVLGVSGNDEVWFNHGDGNYYLAARNQPGGPALGVIDAKTQTLTQLIPTINVTAVINGVKNSGTAHSVAVNPHNNHVFVPLPANNVFPNCLNGCIAVFGTPHEDRD
jgi:hypothetical protein